jgi:hypothetical protein
VEDVVQICFDLRKLAETMFGPARDDWSLGDVYFADGKPCIVYLPTFMHAGASAVPTTQSSAWTQQELNERFMRSLSKDQCMAKTVASLKTGCQSNECIKTLAGITGDCVTWAKGDSKEFCEAYTQNYLGRYCASKELDARSCMLLHIAKPSSPCYDQKQ